MSRIRVRRNLTASSLIEAPPPIPPPLATVNLCLLEYAPGDVLAIILTDEQTGDRRRVMYKVIYEVGTEYDPVGKLHSDMIRELVLEVIADTAGLLQTGEKVKYTLDVRQPTYGQIIRQSDVNLARTLQGRHQLAAVELRNLLTLNGGKTQSLPFRQCVEHLEALMFFEDPRLRTPNQRAKFVRDVAKNFPNSFQSKGGRVRFLGSSPLTTVQSLDEMHRTSKDPRPRWQVNYTKLCAAVRLLVDAVGVEWVDE